MHHVFVKRLALATTIIFIINIIIFALLASA
jgi:hypothetical protein